MGEPLLYNPLIQTRTLSSESLINCLSRAGLTKIGNLRETKGWKTAATRHCESGIRSLRLLQQVIEEVAKCTFWKLQGGTGNSNRLKIGRKSINFHPLVISAAAEEMMRTLTQCYLLKTPEMGTVL